MFVRVVCFRSYVTKSYLSCLNPTCIEYFQLYPAEFQGALSFKSHLVISSTFVEDFPIISFTCIPVAANQSESLNVSALSLIFLARSNSIPPIFKGWIFRLFL